MRIHLDTDLGSDTDDACALVMLLGWPDVEITGITTVADSEGRRAASVATGCESPVARTYPSQPDPKSRSRRLLGQIPLWTTSGTGAPTWNQSHPRAAPHLTFSVTA
jgi:inosine-uridine nucleoside N-ribohydrolase